MEEDMLPDAPITDSAQPDINNTTPETTALTASTGGDFLVPDAYKEAGWAKNIKNIDDLWKMNANAQSLIGKKQIGIPDFSKASENEIEEFYTKLRPENAQAYNIDLPEGDKEMFSDIFFKNGINPKQAEALVSGYKQSIEEAQKPLFSGDGYKKEMESRFGDRFEEKTTSIADFIKKEAAKDDLSVLEKMPNNVLGIVYSIIDKVQTRYAVNDRDTAANSPATSLRGQSDWISFNKEMQELETKPHRMSDINALKDKYNIPHK